MSDNIRTALYDADYTCALANRASDAPRRCWPGWSASTARAATSWSRDTCCPATSRPATCSPCRDRRLLPHMASNYNHVPRPPVVAVRDGASRVHRAPRDRGRPAATRRRTLGREWTADRDGRTDAAARRPAGLRRRRLAGRAAAARAGRRPRRRASARRSSWPAIAVRRPGPAPRRRPAGRPVHHRRRGAGRARRRRRRRRGDRRHRAGPQPAAAPRCERGKSVVTANKALLAEDGATLHDAAARAGVDLYYEAAVAGAIPLLRPLRESLAGDRVTPRAGHRQRHHQLHPRPDGHHRRRLRRGAGRGHRAGVRRGRPDRRRRGVRRRRQGRDPGRRWPSTPGSPPPTCTARASPRSPPPTSPRPARWAAWSSCSRSASADRARRAGGLGRACTRR